MAAVFRNGGLFSKASCSQPIVGVVYGTPSNGYISAGCYYDRETGKSRSLFYALASGGFEMGGFYFFLDNITYFYSVAGESSTDGRRNHVTPDPCKGLARNGKRDFYVPSFHEVEMAAFMAPTAYCPNTYWGMCMYRFIEHNTKTGIFGTVKNGWWGYGADGPAWQGTRYSPVGGVDVHGTRQYSVCVRTED